MRRSVMLRVRSLMVVSAVVAGAAALVPGQASAQVRAAASTDDMVTPTLAAARNADGRIDLMGVNPVTSEVLLQWQSSPGGAWAGWRLQDGTATSVAMERNQDGRLEALAVASNGNVYMKHQETVGGQWTSWSRMIDGGMKSVTIRRRADDRLEIFGTDPAGQVWHRMQVLPNFSYLYTYWELIEGRPMRTVAAETNAIGKGELFGLDADGRLWYRQQYGGENWNPWIAMNAQFTSLAVARNADGRLEVFGTTNNGESAHMSQLSPGGLDWTAPTVIANPPDVGALRSVTAEANADGRIDMFAANANGEVWMRWQWTAGGNWSGWTKMTPDMDSAERVGPVLNVVGMQRDKAIAVLMDGPGFFKTEVALVADPTCARHNTVKAQTPGPGEVAPVGSTIKLAVWEKVASCK